MDKVRARIIAALVLWTAMLAVPEALRGQGYELLRIEADSAKGFDWPYYLVVPQQLVRPVVLLVEPNNSGTVSDDQNYHDSRARNLIESRARDATIQRFGSPILVPTFPRPLSGWQMYTQALDRDTMLSNKPKLVRIDLQLVAMIQDAQSRLGARGITTDSRVFMWGYSASGTFTNRFSILHPEIIKAASLGGCSSPTVPSAEWKGRRLRYPVGIADLPELTGQPFNAQAFRSVPIQIFRGDEDTNDEVAYADGYDREDASLIYELFGGPPPFLRYPKIEGLYAAMNSYCRFVIEPGIGHDATGLYRETWSFFDANRSDPPPRPKPRPLAYKLYFPHVACFENWETEIAIVNTMEMTSLSGELQAYSELGGAPLSRLWVIVAPGGRRQIIVGREFADARNIAYLIFVADSGFAGGYTKFFRQGNRVSIAAAKGARSGALPKMEKQGWTGIALLNTEDNPADAVLTALDDTGMEIASVHLTLPPGVKLANTPEALFKTQLGSATYFRYSSNRKLIGFALNGSADGNMLDGLPALPEYFR